MFDGLQPTGLDVTVYHMASIKGPTIEKLAVLGVSVDNFREVIEELRKIGEALSADDIVSNTFRPSEGSLTLFNPSRFTDGRYGVLYTALETETSIAEIEYHQRKAGYFHRLENDESAPKRYFDILKLDFSGSHFDLFPIADEVPELTSEEDSGYPRCREIAQEAIDAAADALLTPSARAEEGKCLPVFSASSFEGDAKIVGSGYFLHYEGQIVFRNQE